MGTVAAVAAALAGCSAGTTTAPDQTPVDNPTVVVPSAPATTSDSGDAAVSVRASVDVPKTRAVAALVAFVKAHAESVNSGRATPLLHSVTTAGELSRQQQIIGFAVSRAYVVPTTPIIAVVSLISASATRQELGVCLWLPSTEYLDATTHLPPNGPVPKAWAPALATVRLVNVTWTVDNLEKPANETAIRCGGSP